MPVRRIRGAREDEEEVREPVEVDERQGIQGVRAGRYEGLALGPSAHRARDMEPSGGLAPAGEHEARQLRKLRVEAIALALERVDLLLRRAQPPLVLERDGEIGTQVEELVLDAGEHGPDVARAVAGDDDPERRVQLVDRAVRADPRIQLRDT